MSVVKKIREETELIELEILLVDVNNAIEHIEKIGSGNLLKKQGLLFDVSNKLSEIVDKIEFSKK